MTAGNRNARRFAYRRTTGKNLLCRLDWQLTQRHAEQRQREQGRATHCVDIRDGIGRSDAAEIKRIIHDRQKEICRRHDRLLIVQTINGGIITRLGADQQVRVDAGQRRVGEQIRQQRRR